MQVQNTNMWQCSSLNTYLSHLPLLQMYPGWQELLKFPRTTCKIKFLLFNSVSVLIPTRIGISGLTPIEVWVVDSNHQSWANEPKCKLGSIVPFEIRFQSNDLSHDLIFNMQNKNYGPCNQLFLKIAHYFVNKFGSHY